jgi:hypothetical protein
VVLALAEESGLTYYHHSKAGSKSPMTASTPQPSLTTNYDTGTIIQISISARIRHVGFSDYKTIIFSDMIRELSMHLNLKLVFPFAGNMSRYGNYGTTYVTLSKLHLQ